MTFFGLFSQIPFYVLYFCRYVRIIITFYQGIHFVIVYLTHFFWWNMLFFPNFLHTVVETTDFVVILTEDA